MSGERKRTVRVGRVHTDTPLARSHASALERRVTRRGRPIPWSRFERSRYPEPALEVAADAMLALSLGEYGALDSFSQLASALALTGAPMDLVAEATRISADEARHAEYALHAAELYAGRSLSFELDVDTFTSFRAKQLDGREIDLMMLSLPTISETLALGLLTACRDGSTDPVARALFSSVIADEVHHLRLGWFYFTWRAPQWTRADRQHVADAAGRTIAGIERQFWVGRDAPRGSKKAARALGVLDSNTQRRVVRRVVEQELLPGLDALGLGASHAWRVRERGG